MAKGRKPAIGGLARPEGIIDDVIYPVASRVFRSKSVKRVVGSSRSRKVAAKVENRQVSSWDRKADRALDKSVAREYAGLKPKKRIEKKWLVNTNKASAAEDFDELWAGSARQTKYRNQRVRSYAKTTKKKIKKDFKR